jgi:hypothetical protein
MGDEADVGDFPPTVVQLPDPPVALAVGGDLPWERRLGLSALWPTAVQVTLHAEQVGGTFFGRGVVRSLLFAWFAELLAIGSTALTLALLLLMLFPKPVLHALTDVAMLREMLVVATAVVFVLASTLVLLHWFWSLATELGAWHHELPRRVRVGLTLSGYTCGWDLITSPFGIVALLFTRGWRSVGPTLRAAVRAPRRCAVAHLEQARGFSPEQRRAVFLFAAWLTGPIVLAFSMALLVAFVMAMA